MRPCFVGGFECYDQVLFVQLYGKFACFNVCSKALVEVPYGFAACWWLPGGVFATPFKCYQCLLMCLFRFCASARSSLCPSPPYPTLHPKNPSHRFLFWFFLPVSCWQRPFEASFRFLAEVRRARWSTPLSMLVAFRTTLRVRPQPLGGRRKSKWAEQRGKVVGFGCAWCWDLCLEVQVSYGSFIGFQICKTEHEFFWTYL